MTEPVDTAALRALATAVHDEPSWWSAAHLCREVPLMSGPDGALIEAMTPAKVLALCDEIDSLRARPAVPDNIMALINAAAAEIAKRQVEAEKQRADSWMEAGNKLYEIRNGLRLADDAPEDHKRFFDDACRIIFGPTGDEDGESTP